MTMNVYKHLLSVLSKCNAHYISVITAVRLCRNSAVKIHRAVRRFNFGGQNVDKNLGWWTTIAIFVAFLI